MKNYTLICFSCILSSVLFAQEPVTPWSAAAEPQKVFIENKSQFDNCLLKDGEETNSASSKILFATEKAGAQIFFTKGGLTYRLEKSEHKKINEREERERGMSHEEIEKMEHEMEIETDVVNMSWGDANPDVEVIALNPVTHYYTYSLDNKNTVHVKAFQKLLYKNLYPNIDAEYIFHPQQGIEYSFILHPGADASQIKMKYSDVSKIRFDEENNLRFTTLFGDIIDHAPYTIYANANDSNIDSRFIKTGKTISFQLGNYDHSKEVIIDPWTVTPVLPNANKIFCIKADSSNNAYIYGGDSPFKLQKYNSSGVLQWTYTAPWDSAGSWFGTLAVDRAGNSYITCGSIAAIAKISTGGSLVWINTTSIFGTDEYWGLAFNQDETQLVAGGTRLHPFSGAGIIYNINLNDGTQMDTLQVANGIIDVSWVPNEVRSICFSPNGNYYFLTLDTIGSITTSLSINYRTLSGHQFGYGSPAYGFTPQGQNIICANSNFIYTSNGDSIEKRDINTGNILMADTIPGGACFYAPLNAGIFPKNGGVALDDCGNVYVGSQTGVYKYDGNLNLLSSANTPGEVYAIAVNNNGEVLACGDSFAVSINMSACSPYLHPSLGVTASHTNSSCAGLCNGSANAAVVGGTIPYTFLWSNAATTQSVTGLCAGSYSVTATDNTGSSAIASVTIASNTLSVTDSVINTPCGGNSGVAGIMSVSGISPYSFSWSTGATSSVIFGLSPGVYSVTITDSVGCVVADTLTVQGTGSASIAITASQLNFCANDSSRICAPSGYSNYLWSNGATDSCIVVHTGGNYSVTVTDNGVCTASSTPVTIGVLQLPVITAVLNGNIFSVSSLDSLIAYQWNLNDTAILGANSQTYAAAQAGNYSVAATGLNGCVAVSSPVFYSPCSAYFVLFPDLTTPHNWWAINQATGSPPLTYLWSWGDGNTSSGAFPTHLYSAPGNYNICVSIVDANNCTASYCDSSVYIYKTADMISVNVVSEVPTGITESILPAGMFVYPNPASTELNINIGGLQADRVRIYNTNGQLVIDAKQPKGNRIYINPLATGVYVVEVQVLGITGRLRWTKM